MKTINRVLASTFALIIAFIASRLMLNLMLYGLASTLKYDAEFHYNEVIVPYDWHLWNKVRVIFVNFIPPVVCAIISLFIYRNMSNRPESWGRYQLLGYWLMICFGNIFISELMCSPLGVADTLSAFYHTFSRVFAWLNIPSVVAGGIAVGAILLGIGGGYYVCEETVKLSPSNRLTQKRSGKNMIVLLYYVTPLMLAAAPLLLLCKPLTWLRTLAILTGLAVPIIGMFIRIARGPFAVNIHKKQSRGKFPFVEIIVAAGMWAWIYLKLK
jgi:hypothetical protein